jgi:hypothetical protein
MTEQELLAKYPKIFRQKDLSLRETCMCWGIECGTGWFPILDKLCDAVQGYCDANGIQVEFSQVKEKYGTLRIYADNTPDVVLDMIDMAEDASAKTCEVCGSPGEVVCFGGWYMARCPECMRKHRQVWEDQKIEEYINDPEVQ